MKTTIPLLSHRSHSSHKSHEIPAPQAEIVAQFFLQKNKAKTQPHPPLRGWLTGLCPIRHSRFIRVDRRVQNWAIIRTLHEASRGALALGLSLGFHPIECRNQQPKQSTMAIVVIVTQVQ